MITEQAPRDGRSLLRRAFVASLCLHLLVALFLPLWGPGVPSRTVPVEAVSFARVVQIRMRRARAASTPPAALPQTKKKAAKVRFARVKAELTARRSAPRSRPTPVKGPPGVDTAAPRFVATRGYTPIHARAASSSEPIAGVPPIATTAAPQATGTAPPQTGLGVADRGGVLPFGATQDPVLDPGVRAQLGRRFNVRVTLLVTVGEDGRTKHVAFAPPLDARTEREIEALLSAANWDAAVCGGGVSCEGVATIKL